MKFKVTWQSNYNGVSVDPIGVDDYRTVPEDDITKFDAIGDEAMDTLPDYTYEVAERWEGLGVEEITELKRRALTIINKCYPDVTIDDIEYEEDSFST
jgi:hypothetical protein